MQSLLFLSHYLLGIAWLPTFQSVESIKKQDFPNLFRDQSDVHFHQFYYLCLCWLPLCIFLFLPSLFKTIAAWITYQLIQLLHYKYPKIFWPSYFFYILILCNIIIWRCTFDFIQTHMFVLVTGLYNMLTLSYIIINSKLCIFLCLLLNHTKTVEQISTKSCTFSY